MPTSLAEFFRSPDIRNKESMERQTRLIISKSPCIKSGLDLGCIKGRRGFRVLVKSVVVGIMADKGLVLSFVLVGRPYKSI